MTNPKKPAKPKFPSITAVATSLRQVNATLDSESDVRLQVYEDGQWAIRVGDSSYDTDHRGYWGASSLHGKRFNSEDLARDLIDQAKDQYAAGAADDESEIAPIP